MAKRRRKRGAFDPDYRTKGWNKSAFAPKNSTLSITQLSLAIAFLLFISLYFIPATKPAMMTMPGLIAAGIGVFVIWIALALILRRWAGRQIPKQTEPTKITFDEPDESTIQPKVKMVIDAHQHVSASPLISPVDVQLQERRARLQGVIEPTAMTPRDFEHEVAWVLNTITDYKAVPVGGAGDRGVDVKVYRGSKLVGIVQCKRFTTKSPVAPGHIRELSTVKNQFGVKTAYLVTTSRFTPNTEREAAKLGIKLIDGEEWERMRKRAREVQGQLQQNELGSSF